MPTGGADIDDTRHRGRHVRRRPISEEDSDLEGDEFLIGPMGERRKTRNVRHDPRVALSKR